MTFDFSTVTPREPGADGLNGEFYTLAATGKIHLQRCSGCGHIQHPPRHRCRACLSEDLAWVRTDGMGTLYSWTTTYFAYDRGWAPAVPYCTGVVELPEGVRLIAAMGMGIEPRLDMPVQVVTAPTGEGHVLLSIITRST